tara:strand:- start:788 stop:1291 length:504 start_codon:yes stop_codon:yes gene_type:complete
MSFYNHKGLKSRLCVSDENEEKEQKKELMNTFGRFSKYFLCDNYYTNNNPIINCSKLRNPGNNPCPNTRVFKEVLTSSESTKTRVATLVLEKPISDLCNRENKQSDRKVSSNTKLDVPSRGNSVKRTLTSHRPGAQSAPGKGSDIKYNSYDRHNLRIIGKVIHSEKC